VSKARAEGAIERGGWRINFVESASDGTVEIAELALNAMNGAYGKPHRRSRHATTYRISRTAHPGKRDDYFVKVLDAPAGIGRIKHALRGRRAEHVVAVSRELTQAGFCVAPVLIFGHELDGGREFLVTRCADGEGALRVLRALAVDPPLHKWRLLQALGCEIARLHLRGFVHGDLTPYNIFVIRGEPPRFVFIDHERTRRNFPPGRYRRQLRNLVQLGRFILPGLTRTDRARVLRAYSAAISKNGAKRLRRRAAAMLARRLKRDRRAAELSRAQGRVCE
jgi:hypothetical protein